MFKEKADKKGVDSKRFEEVLAEELEYLIGLNRESNQPDSHNRELNEPNSGRRKADKSGNDKTADCGTPYAATIVEKANSARLTGLAFSGGGIRSATFNLGVLQALARLKLLNEFHYLSTVSGGGYIGSWFTAWRHRVDNPKKSDDDSEANKNQACADLLSPGLEGVELELASSVSARNDRRKRGAMQPDPAPIWHLREYSSYLSPRRGLWSTDTWTLGVTYLRNLVLTISLLLLTLITVVLVTRFIVSMYFYLAHYTLDTYWVLGSFCLCLFGASLLAGIELFVYPRLTTPFSSNVTFFLRYGSYFTVSFILCAAAFGALWLWHWQETNSLNHALKTLLAGFCALLGLVSGPLIHEFLSIRRNNPFTFKKSLPKFMAIAIRAVISVFILIKKSLPKFMAIAISAVISVCILIILLVLLAWWMEGWSDERVCTEKLPPDPWSIVVWGTPLLVGIFSIVAVLFVGLTSSDLRELDREWFGRIFAALFQWTALTTFLVVLVVYSSYWVKEWNDWEIPIPILGPAAVWGTLSVAGAFLARNVMMGKSTVEGWFKKTVFTIAPYVFILGMMIFSVWVTDHGVDKIVKIWKPLEVTLSEDILEFWGAMAGEWKLRLAGMWVVTFLFAFLWSWRIGVNRFSLHSMYADRLIRAYLGASNLQRDEHPFTGFDESDNEVRLADLVKGCPAYAGPYPIINASINLVSSSRLAWQKRKAASFTFTPKYCGYEYCGEREESAGGYTGRVGGFVESSRYAGKDGKGLSLGKAMAISGAAASPNMGYHSSPALACLMTTFNVRLGWWIPNTSSAGRRKQTDEEPEWGYLYLLSELFGKTSAKKEYVYLSDGGHFENLGIYELVRRRCRIIVACDASADRKQTFSGLGNAIEKCQTDLGVPINIDTTQIKEDSVTGHSLWHCAVGCIRYSEADRKLPDGTIVYIKASLTGDEPENIATYANNNTDFPHETTFDQWFDETQFESYRALGEHIVMKVLGNATDVASLVKRENKKGRFLERVIREARKQWYPGTREHVQKPVDLDALLESIMDMLRNDVRLAFLDKQMYPNLKKVADAHFSAIPEHSIPVDYGEFRAGFYFCKRLIQFMQQVYHERQLDLEYAAPRNRGWMNLFRRWAWSQMLRFTWTLTVGTYGARFQSFCEHRLHLDTGSPKFKRKPLEIKAIPPRCPEQKELRLVPPPDKWTDHGLHHYEICLIEEYIGAYVDHKDLWFLKRFDFEVFPLTVAADDPISEKGDKAIQVNAGFLIAGPLLKESPDEPPGCETAILYFRIRPSMRNMDLARTAFLETRKHDVLKNYKIDPQRLPPVSEEAKESKPTQQLRRACREVHQMDRESLDHCHWFKRLAEEEDNTNNTLCDYLLSRSHPIGKYKSPLFEKHGFSYANSERLERELQSLEQHGKRETEEGEYGTIYKIRGSIKAPSGSTVEAVTYWIQAEKESHLRIISAYLEREHDNTDI